MKNIFGLNRSRGDEDMGADEFDGASFITASVQKDKEPEVTEPKKAAPKLPLPLAILQYVFLIAFTVAFTVWVSSGESIRNLLVLRPIVPYAMFSGFGGFVIIIIIDFARSKKFAKENGIKKVADIEEFVEIHEVDEEAEAAAEATVKAELGIPDNAIDMDFLSFFYREDENGPFPIKPFDFMTLEMFVYSDGEFLHIADYNDVYSIKLSDITGVEQVAREATLLGWSKDESFDSEKYAAFGLTENSEGFIVIPYYYSAFITAENADGESEKFKLLIPPYEHETFLKLISK